ncbi:MAG: hypothetical protein DMD82_14775, partial [Candidatus Rokuibacteriota bacterium]
FVPVEYWSLHARLRGKTPPEFVATLREVRGERASLPNEAATRALMESLQGAPFTVKAVNRGERRRNPAPPFITSTLQQDAGRKLHFTAKKTMLIAQQLYEGVELPSEGAVGLITYMRTDSTRVAAEALTEARGWVTERLGREYLPDAPPVYRVNKSAQEAHEAIRPSEIAREPKLLAQSLTKDQLALYRLIWERLPWTSRGGRACSGRRARRSGSRASWRSMWRAATRARRPPRRTPRSSSRRSRWPRRSRCVRSIPSSTSPSRRPASRRRHW